MSLELNLTDAQQASDQPVCWVQKEAGRLRAVKPDAAFSGLEEMLEVSELWAGKGLKVGGLEAEVEGYICEAG